MIREADFGGTTGMGRRIGRIARLAIAAALLSAGLPAVVSAQTLNDALQAKTNKTGEKDKLLVEAGEIVYNDDKNTVSAVGDVQLHYQGRTLQADQVVYDRNTKRVLATGNARITEAVEKYRDAFKYIHDQALHLANQGFTMLEIAEMLKLPPELASNWATRGYYGSVSHDAKAVYNLYLGFFSANPADLEPLPPAQSAVQYVEFMGGADAVIQKAQKSFDAGDYRWVAEVLKQVVYADPKNQKARNLQADAFEQLGYQAESGPWRNFYLSGAKELRDGVKKAATPNTASPDIARAMSLDQIFDFLAIRLDGPRAAGKDITLNFKFTDTKQNYTLKLKNGVLNHFEKLSDKPDATYTLTRTDLDNVLLGQARVEDLVKEGKVKVEGTPGKVTELLALLDTFDFWFDVITPNQAETK